jgi:hypothetical protein
MLDIKRLVEKVDSNFVMNSAAGLEYIPEMSALNTHEGHRKCITNRNGKEHWVPTCSYENNIKMDLKRHTM